MATGSLWNAFVCIAPSNRRGRSAAHAHCITLLANIASVRSLEANDIVTDPLYQLDCLISSLGVFSGRSGATLRSPRL